MTKQQEIYIQARVRGETQRQAYYIAYPHSKKWKEKTVDEHACRLEKNGKVKARLEELKAKARIIEEKQIEKGAEKAVRDRGAMLDKLYRMLGIAMGEEPTKTLVKELIDGNPVTTINKITVKADLNAAKGIAELISKFEGWYKEKIQLEANVKHSYAEMTDDELKQNLLLKYKEGKISKKELEEMGINI